MSIDKLQSRDSRGSRAPTRAVREFSSGMPIPYTERIFSRNSDMRIERMKRENVRWLRCPRMKNLRFYSRVYRFVLFLARLSSLFLVSQTSPGTLVMRSALHIARSLVLVLECYRLGKLGATPLHEFGGCQRFLYTRLIVSLFRYLVRIKCNKN